MTTEAPGTATTGVDEVTHERIIREWFDRAVGNPALVAAMRERAPQFFVQPAPVDPLQQRERQPRQSPPTPTWRRSPLRRSSLGSGGQHIKSEPRPRRRCVRRARCRLGSAHSMSAEQLWRALVRIPFSFLSVTARGRPTSQAATKNGDTRCVDALAAAIQLYNRH